MYKIIASDLDETLLQSDKHVSQKDIETIRNLDEDIRFVVCTGRGFASVQGTLKEIGLHDKQNEYTISYNGGIITENKGNKIIYCKGLTHEEAEMLFNIGLKYDVCIHVYTVSTSHVYRLTEDEKEYLNGRQELTILDEPNISSINEQIMKILFCNTDMEYLKKIEQEINLNDRFSISYSAGRYLEFNPAGIDKGVGLENLARLLKIDMKDTIAVGDNVNDLPMIKKAGLGIGVSNVYEGIRKDCDVILESDYNHSPINEIALKYL